MFHGNIDVFNLHDSFVRSCRQLQQDDSFIPTHSDQISHKRSGKRGRAAHGTDVVREVFTGTQFTLWKHGTPVQSS